MENNKIPIKKRIASGLIWTYAERTISQLITIIVTIILARLIAPSEYGIISLVVIFINIANTLVVSGLGTSLIQKKHADNLDFSTLFYFSILFSLIIYFIIFFCAPLIARFYNIPLLVIIVRVMAIRLPIAAINSIQEAYISRKLEFKKFFFVTLFGTIFSAIVGIVMAYKGFGVWALVVQYISGAIVNTVMLTLSSGWKPELKFSMSRLVSLFSYGWKIMLVGILNEVYSNLRNLIIAKRYSSSDLAFSDKGDQFPRAIAGNVNTSLSKVLFPILSNIQDDKLTIKSMVRRSIKTGSYVLFPVLFGFASIAPSFVSLLLTNNWIECVPYLQIFCIVYAFQPIQTSSLQAMKALGRSELYLKLEIIKKFLGVLILWVSVFYFDSVVYIILGALFAELISTLVNFPVNKALIKYGYKEQLLDVLPSIILSLIMSVSIILLGSLISNLLIKMLIQLICGVILYIIMSILTKNENFYYILDLVKSYKTRR